MYKNLKDFFRRNKKTNEGYFGAPNYKINIDLTLLCLTLASLNALGQQAPNSVARDSSPTLVSSRFGFTEGPAVDSHGNIFFTDQPNNKIWEYDIHGKLWLFLDGAGRSNGMYFDKHGNLITCADEKNQLWLITPKRKVTVLLKDFKGHRFNGPNDLWIDAKEGIYFTDPYFQRDYWQRTAPDPAIKGERLYYLPKGKKDAIVVDKNLQKPNGITGNREGYLFVSDIGVGKIFKYELNADGTFKNRRVFAEDVADGMTLDNKGNLYLAGKGVTVYDSTGERIQHFDIPAKWTSNVCFGGRKRDVLFITASESIYILRMCVQGIE